MILPKGIKGLSAYPATLSLMWPNRDTTSLLIKPYQRPYSWTGEHIKTLFRDQFFPLANPKIDGKVTNSFIGAVVVLPGKCGAELVDGQQRLTTLTMTIGVGSRLLKLTGAQLPESCRKFFKLYEGKHWIDVKPINKKCYEMVMDLTVSKGKLDKYVDDNDEDVMCAAIKHIEESIEDYIDISGRSRSEAIKSLLDTLVSDLGLVVVQVKSHEQALDVFQALNAGGMPLTLDQLVKSLILKTYAKLGSEVEEIIDTQWEGESAESFNKCIKSANERSDFLIFYFKAFVGVISTRTAYSNYKNWLEDEFKQASDKREHFINLIDSLQRYWIFYSKFKPLLFQMGAKILIPVLFASRERIQLLGAKDSSIDDQMQSVAFTLESGFARVILMKTKLNQVEARVVNLCKTLLKSKTIDDLHYDIKDFYCHRALGLDNNALFRRSIEEYKFKNSNKVAILMLRRVNEAMRSKSCNKSHQIGLINTKANFGAKEALPFDKNAPNKFLESHGYVTDGNFDSALYKTLAQSIANLLLTSDLVTDLSRMSVNEPYTKSLKVDKRFLEKRGKVISDYASKIWSIN
jgi:uncharacterized protein with ParB-like and HNH nuclease domain